MIKSEIVAHSLSPQGDELISVLCTFPRIILAEVNTHRMLSKNTSSSRAIPFKKMVEAVQSNPFIPIAWQKHHSGMQGSEYFNERVNIETTDLGDLKFAWLEARNHAVKEATWLNKVGVTKQLCNRLLEPFMWTTMLITGSREGWDNFFKLRCPVYEITCSIEPHFYFKSSKDLNKFLNEGDNERVKLIPPRNYSLEENLKVIGITSLFEINKGQAEIHMMALAECIWDSVNESTPKQLVSGQWHIPFGDKIKHDLLTINQETTKEGSIISGYIDSDIIKISTAMCARTSYTIVGEEKEVNYEKMIALHDRLLTQEPPHSSPFEHCARAMSNKEYICNIKGQPDLQEFINEDNFGIAYHKVYQDNPEAGWCNNLKGFIPYRYLVDNKINL
jgi:thymidylate synthase ThyX